MILQNEFYYQGGVQYLFNDNGHRVTVYRIKDSAGLWLDQVSVAYNDTWIPGQYDCIETAILAVKHSNERLRRIYDSVNSGKMIKLNPITKNDLLNYKP